jgi:hypothetical protein
VELGEVERSGVAVDDAHQVRTESSEFPEVAAGLGVGDQHHRDGGVGHVLLERGGDPPDEVDEPGLVPLGGGVAVDLCSGGADPSGLGPCRRARV